VGYAQVFKSRVNDVYDRLDEKFSEHQIEEEARGENLKEQVNEAKADISKAEKVAFSYSRAVSGAGEAGRPFLQAAIQKNNDLLENSYKQLKALETEYSEWQNQFYELNQTAKILSFEKAKRAPDFLEYSLLGLSREIPVMRMHPGCLFSAGVLFPGK
jgi:chromosome segregation ATPase